MRLILAELFKRTEAAAATADAALPGGGDTEDIYDYENSWEKEVMDDRCVERCRGQWGEWEAGELFASLL